ncbi:Ger(x)C family spore germination protein [Clostridium sp. YIM B02505]|uniref:Ger(X)C family spore germination protein n=1 Tax=Clostridium yunnanense TaxID=2800325 RepID=A0ABS1EQ66_9CLOT|nr:Ger(x)C family spore germination protein [Clostridium yunnanense]MBK1811469.1 Ger(x)C family spore germination protein [Clostridium yunnanense]
MKISKCISILMILVISVNLTGCWNYREIESMSIVAGVAIDRSQTTKQYEMTAEIIDIESGKDSRSVPRYITLTGDSIFDIARNMITISDRKLYWSHAKCIIVSTSLAREGLGNIIDWFIRDAETRSDMYLLVSTEKTAKEIITASPTSGKIMSLELSRQLKNQKLASRAPILDLWDFADSLIQPGKSATVPRVFLNKQSGIPTPSIDGIAIFKKDTLIGIIEGTETKYLLFALNKIKGGLLLVYTENQKPLTLEIFQSKTKIKPVLKGDSLNINIMTETVVSIAEDQPLIEFYKEEQRKEIERNASLVLQNSIYNSIRKVQEEYGSDIFGFGTKVHEDMPKAWKKLSTSWSDRFKELPISVTSKVKIKNSATTSKPLEIGD